MRIVETRQTITRVTRLSPIVPQKRLALPVTPATRRPYGSYWCLIVSLSPPPSLLLLSLEVFDVGFAGLTPTF